MIQVDESVPLRIRANSRELMFLKFVMAVASSSIDV